MAKDQPTEGKGKVVDLAAFRAEPVERDAWYGDTADVEDYSGGNLGRFYIAVNVNFLHAKRLRELGGQAFLVLVLIHHRRMRTQRTEDISLPGELLALMGVTRKALDHSLEALEKSGYIAVTRAKGKRPRIKILIKDLRGQAVKRRGV